MLTLNQYNETDRKRLITNSITFYGNPAVLQKLKTTTDSVVISESAKLNMKALKWIKSAFKHNNNSLDTLFYSACSNSDNNISESALNFLKDKVSQKKKFLSALFQQQEKPAYQNFGDKFLAIMLEAAKNNESNHTAPNIDFLRTVLDNYEDENPKNYLDVVVNSKDSDGNINPKTSDVFKMFYSKNGNTSMYFDFMKGLLALPKNEQNFIFSNFSKHRNSVLFKFLQLSQGDDSEKLIETISENLDNRDAEYMMKCLSYSKDTNNCANLYNFQRLLKEHVSEKILKEYEKEIRDKKGLIQDGNINAVKELSDLFKEYKEKQLNQIINSYISYLKDDKGVVDKDFSKNLIDVLSKTKHPEDYENIIKCIKLLTNKKGEIQWQYVNNITSLKRHTDKSLECTKHDTFRKILNILTDKDGNVLPSFNDFTSKINEMIKDGLLTEIPIILSMVQKDGVIEDELCKALKSLVLNESAEKRYETAKKLADLAKNGFDKDFFTKLNKITNLKINGDKYKILNELKNSDDKISQTGFDFLVHLRKECHIKEEKDIISFLKLSKNKSGDFSDENISYIKDISKIVPKYEIAKIYISASKESTGNVDKNYYDNLIKVLAEKEHPEDYKNILASIGSAKNKKGEIQWKYVNNLYKFKTICDESKMGKKFKTFSKIMNAVKNNDGNIVPELIESANECRHEKMLYEIPTIISLSKDKDHLNKDNYKRVVKILKDTATEDRYKMSEYIKEQAEKAGSLKTPKIKIIERLQELNISKNLLGISHFLKNPDGSISVSGLNLVSDLRKTYHHQIESDLVKILKVSRDRTGYINKKNADAIKELLHINKNIDAAGLVKSTLNKKGEVDSDKYKIVVKLITEYKMSDTATINKIINMSKDKKGNIDSGILKLFVTLAKKGKKPEDYNKIIPAYKALYKYEHATSLSQLNLRQKRDLMRALKRYYHSDMQTSQFKEILPSKIFPSDESEYCSVMGRLSHSIGISVKKLPKDVETKYYKAMKTLENPKGDFMNLDFDKNPPVLELKYPLKDFKRDIMDSIANYSYSERTKALDYFGFELKKEDGIVRLSGFPNADKPDGRLSSIKDKRVLHLINKLSPYVIEFATNNKVTVKGSKEMSEALTDIITAFPEFLTTVGKRQHHTHDYTLDVHCLKVLQDVFKNPEYQTLSHTDRKEMQIIALFHDLSKAENQVDRDHPENSAFNIYYLLNKLDMKEKDKLEIYNVIRNHDWLTHFDFSEYAAKDIAFNMRGSESLKMLLMLSRADLKGVKKHDAYYKMYGNKLKKAEMKIQPYLRDLQRTAIHLPQTKIPKASELNQHSGVVDKIHADGITNTVLYLKPNYDLGKAGFKTCRSTNDFNVLVHGLDSKDAAAMFQALGIIDSDALLSTSYILYSKGNYRAFRNEGFVLDVAATNIHAAYWRDFGSGYRKTISDTLYNTYLFRNNPTRNYISDALRQELKLTDKEYIQLFKEIEDMPIEELEKKHPHTAHAYKKLFNDMEISKRSFGRNYNEVLLSSPKIQGIFCYGKSPESISVYLRRYAEKNDIPIIVFG